MLALQRFLTTSVLFACTIVAARGGDSEARDHWAFRRLLRPAMPTVKYRSAMRSPVDALLLAGLEQKGLSPAPEADRATLLRRLSFDLTGLPPRPEETARFVADPVPDAYSRVVERLLASPHYGERWGKYWLDVAGYADSNGYFNADSDRPLAYKYRDYVIRSFNRDRPYDQFVREQLAGDELSGYLPGQRLTREVVEQFTATHFLRNGQDGSGESDGNPDEVRIDRATVLQGTLQITMNSLLGLTIQCCRCHEHKFEPIAAAEYYQLQSIFYPAFPAYDAEHWIKPKDRVREMPEGDDAVVWQNHERQIDDEKTRADQRAMRIGSTRTGRRRRSSFATNSRGRAGCTMPGGAPLRRRAVRTQSVQWLWIPRERPRAELKTERSRFTNPIAAIDGSSRARLSTGGRLAKEIGSKPPSTWSPIESTTRRRRNESPSSLPRRRST